MHAGSTAASHRAARGWSRGAIPGPHRRLSSASTSTTLPHMLRYSCTQALAEHANRERGQLHNSVYCVVCRACSKCAALSDPVAGNHRDAAPLRRQWRTAEARAPAIGNRRGIHCPAEHRRKARHYHALAPGFPTVLRSGWVGGGQGYGVVATSPQQQLQGSLNSRCSWCPQDPAEPARRRRVKWRKARWHDGLRRAAGCLIMTRYRDAARAERKRHGNQLCGITPLAA